MILNIGDKTTEGRKVTFEMVLQALDNIGNYSSEGGRVRCLYVTHLSAPDGGDEGTYVVGMDGPMPRYVVHILAQDLEQDCIAAEYSNGYGFLAGPRSAKWGDFDPEQFRYATLAGAEHDDA